MASEPKSPKKNGIEKVSPKKGRRKVVQKEEEEVLGDDVFG